MKIRGKAILKKNSRRTFQHGTKTCFAQSLQCANIAIGCHKVDKYKYKRKKVKMNKPLENVFVVQ